MTLSPPLAAPNSALTGSAYGLVSGAAWTQGRGVAVSSRRMWSPAHAVIAIMALGTVLRAAAAATFGLGIDESYMVAAGRTLQLSYFDHPPLGWWLSWSAVHLFGSEMPLVVRLPFIALFAASTWLMYRLTASLFLQQAGVWAALAFNTAPVFGFTSASWVLPDGPLIAALLGGLACLARATDPRSRRAWAWWLGLGLCGGLALLAKYTAILVLSGAAMAVATHPVQRRWLRRPQPWVAMALAVALFSPVIAWNVGHHWCSIAFQGGRALGAGWHPFAPIAVLVGEALYLLPWIWLPLILSLGAAWRRGRSDWPGWMLACSAMPPIILFAMVGLWSRGHVLPHWAAPGYLALFPLLGVTLARWARTDGRMLRRIAAASASLVTVGVAVVGSEVRWNWLPIFGEDFAAGADPDLAAVDWASLVPQLRARGWIGSGNVILATLQWRDAGKLDYALGGAATVICLGDDPREFGLIHPAAPYAGQNAIVLSSDAQTGRTEASLRRHFEQIAPLPPLTLMHAGRPAATISAFLGKRLLGSDGPMPRNQEGG